MKSTYDEEIIVKIKKSIFNKDVEILESDKPYFDILEKKYKVGYSGIDWNSTKYIYFEKVNEIDEKEKGEKIDRFLKKIIINYPSFENSSIVLIGDNLTDLGYKMTFKKFVDLHHNFFDVPQHWYVYFEDFGKCLNYTFENELFFG